MLHLPTPEMQQHYMTLAFAEAQLACDRQEVPIGAVLVDYTKNEIVATGHNLTITQTDPTAHAEIVAIRAACQKYGAQRIPECDLYVTLEPCPMCASAISFARIRHVFFAAEDVKSGGFINGPGLSTHAALHHKSGHTVGLMAEQSAKLLQDFFKARRNKS